MAQETFGKYRLKERLAFGGMAEVFLASVHGEAGFAKPVVIKRLHPRFSEDSEFVQMLIDEAHITAQLASTNICQVLDLGQVDGAYYIAMEYIAGEDLRKIQDVFGRRKNYIPVTAALYIVAEMLAGLDYAHRKEGSDGKPLEVIHRDISPHNVLISYEGEVKVIDFGIAKARMRMVQTQAGVIKGKFRYMSPEQASGAPIDHRSDIFAAGVVLYELIRGAPHSLNVPDTEVLRRMREAEFEPIHRSREEVPDELLTILSCALHRKAKKRYATAGEFRDALLKFLRELGGYGRSDLAQMMRELFDDERRRKRGGQSAGDRSSSDAGRDSGRATDPFKAAAASGMPDQRMANEVAADSKGKWVAYSPATKPIHGAAGDLKPVATVPLNAPGESGSVRRADDHAMALAAAPTSEVAELEMPRKSETERVLRQRSDRSAPVERVDTGTADTSFATIEHRKPHGQHPAEKTDHLELKDVEVVQPATHGTINVEDAALPGQSIVRAAPEIQGAETPAAESPAPLQPAPTDPDPPARQRRARKGGRGAYSLKDHQPYEPHKVADDPAAMAAAAARAASDPRRQPRAHAPAPTASVRPAQPGKKGGSGGLIAVVILIGVLAAAAFFVGQNASKFGLGAPAKPDSGAASKPKPAKVSIRSTPSGARIRLCGEDTGKTTPATVEIKGGQSCQLQVEKSGYASYETQVEVPSGETFRVATTLRKRARRTKRTVKSKKPRGDDLLSKGELVVTSIKMAKVYIGGKFAGSTPRLSVKLTPGIYRVHVKFSGLGKKSRRRRVTVHAGQQAKLHFAPDE